MEHGALTEETNRFQVALAAAEVGARPIHMIDGPVDRSRRSYFFAKPGSDNGFSVDDLAARIGEEKLPVLVDWDKKSEYYGLRYTLSGLEIPGSLKSFQSLEAKEEWGVWRQEQKSADRVVSQVSTSAAKGKRLDFLDVEISDPAPRKLKSGPVNEL